MSSLRSCGPNLPRLQSVIHKPLVERHKILSAMVGDAPEAGIQLGESPMVGRVFPLVPYRRFLNGMSVSKVSRSEEDIQDAFESALRGQVGQLSQAHPSSLSCSTKWLHHHPVIAHIPTAV